MAVDFQDPAAATRIFGPMAGVSSRGSRVDPRVVFQQSGRTPGGCSYRQDSRGVVDYVQFLRTETFPWGGEVVGILVAVMELPWGLVSIGVALVPVSRIWQGSVATALGGLQCRYQ